MFDLVAFLHLMILVTTATTQVLTRTGYALYLKNA